MWSDQQRNSRDWRQWAERELCVCVEGGLCVWVEGAVCVCVEGGLCVCRWVERGD